MDNVNKVIQYSQNIKLLYVEDNQEARESTMDIFEEFFDDITIAVDGENGYEIFKNSSFDLIITDINMPKLNGIDMISKIRAMDRNIPILVLSANNESNYFIDTIKFGIEGYLLKPIDLDQFIGVLKKVTEKLKLQNQLNNQIHLLNQYQEATDHSTIVSKTDLSGIITYVNSKFCTVSGYSKDELLGKNHNIIRHPDNPKSFYQEMWNTIRNKKQIWKGIVRNRNKFGKSYYVNTTIKPIVNEDGEILEYIALRDDITDIMNPKKQLEDALTNAKNPVLVYLKLEDYSALEEFYDNNTIEKIQDSIKIYLETHIPSHCNFENVYQLGGGEYALLSEKELCIQNEEEFIKDIKIYQEIVEKGKVDTQDIDYDMSIAISIAYDDPHALESAKLGIKKLLQTKQNFIISSNFVKIEHEKAQNNIKTLSMVKKALNNSQIVSYFQPIINNSTQSVEKYESLVRLLDENGKMLPPGFFLEVAKKGKYYSAITNMVLDNSFDALNNTNLDISINLSALDIEQKETREKLLKLLQENQEYCSRIIFELLEDESVKDFETIKQFISNVKSLGVQIAIDDFGAGYSNFERLLNYQPDILKIDGSLIKNIETSQYSLCVVKTIVAFAKEQNIKTVAEFVENETIFNILHNLNVDYSQGYYFGKPEPLEVYNKK